MANVTDPEEARLRAAVEVARTAYREALAALTPEANLLLAAHDARGPDGHRRFVASSDRELAEAFWTASEAVKDAKRAVHAHHDAQDKARVDAGREHQLERNARKALARAARGPGNGQPIGTIPGRER